MTDFMDFIYANYIHPYIKSQPMDDGDYHRFTLWESERTPLLEADVAVLVQFAATHGFLLGVRTGAGLCASTAQAAGDS